MIDDYNVNGAFRYAVFALAMTIREFRSQHNWETDENYKKEFEQYKSDLKAFINDKFLDMFADCSNNFENGKLRKKLLEKVDNLKYNYHSPYKTRF